MKKHLYVVYVTVPQIKQEIRVIFETEVMLRNEDQALNYALNELECNFINVDKLRAYQETKGLQFEVTDGEFTVNEIKKFIVTTISHNEYEKPLQQIVTGNDVFEAINQVMKDITVKEILEVKRFEEN